ncbi:hypothetical protein BSP239C_00383 [Brevibacterium sp. 239c]|nr:hypothetical protein BSP239C_00383 [Brevibacterium sp. 239c]
MRTLAHTLKSALDSGDVSVSISRCCNALRWVITARTSTDRSCR